MRQTVILKGRGWRLPVYVLDRGEEFVLVRRCRSVPILKVQLEVVESRLDAMSINRKGWTWFVPRRTMETLSYAVKEIEPEIFWALGKKEGVEMGDMDIDNGEYFYEEMVRMGMFTSIETAKVVWHMLCKIMLRCMMNKRKAIDLGFCLLWPCMYRANWKQIMLQQDLLRSRKKVRFHKRTGQEIVEDVAPFMLEKMFYAVDRNGEGQAMWTLDVQHKKAWFEMNRKIEKIRYSERYEKHAYWGRIREFTRMQIPRIIESYRVHLLQIFAPDVETGFYHHFGSKKDKREKARLASSGISVRQNPIQLFSRLGRTSRSRRVAKKS